MSKVLVLKTVEEDMTAYGGFLWKKKGVVEAPDWNPTPICGGGLHGYLWGEGDGDSILRDPNTKWLVLSVEESDIVYLGGKIKFPKCSVVYCGDRIGATEKILKERPESICIGAIRSVGDNKTVIVGAHGFATAGYKGIATAGYGGIATAGEYGTATAGVYGTATVGDYGIATAGNNGIATAGNYGTATAGWHGTATAGYYGAATAGHCGTATAGYKGIATAGYNGTVTAGECGQAKVGKGGSIHIKYWDGNRYKLLCGYEGEDIEANVFYRVKDGKFVKV